MRAYTVADVFAVADIFAAVTENGGGLGGLLKADGGAPDGSAAPPDEGRGLAIANYLLGVCLAKCRDKIVGWFASLNEMTAEEYNALPPERLLDTVEEIAARPESKDFFLRASRLFSKIGGSGIITEKG